MHAGCASVVEEPARASEASTTGPLVEDASQAPPTVQVRPAHSEPTMESMRAPEDADDDAGAEAEQRNQALSDAQAPGGNDLTYPCRVDDDCNYGACYVPGTRQNPICSKRCDTDLDCPQGALCAGPLECQDTNGPCVGSGFCFRACEADAECTAHNALDTEPDADPSDVNPVACIAWVDIIGSTPDEPVFEPIDICIQESEP